MRKCRKGLVQTQEQLRFAYEVILYGALKILGQDKISCTINFDVGKDNQKRDIRKVATSAASPKSKRSRSAPYAASSDSLNVVYSNSSTQNRSENLR